MRRITAERPDLRYCALPRRLSTLGKQLCCKTLWTVNAYRETSTDNVSSHHFYSHTRGAVAVEQHHGISCPQCGAQGGGCVRPRLGNGGLGTALQAAPTTGLFKGMGVVGNSGSAL